MYTSTKDVHDQEMKIRLTESDMDRLQIEAARLGLPPAVLARRLIKQNLDEDEAVSSLTDKLLSHNGGMRNFFEQLIRTHLTQSPK